LTVIVTVGEEAVTVDVCIVAVVELLELLLEIVGVEKGASTD